MERVIVTSSFGYHGPHVDDAVGIERKDIALLR